MIQEVIHIIILGSWTVTLRARFIYASDDDYDIPLRPQLILLRLLVRWVAPAVVLMVSLQIHPNYVLECTYSLFWKVSSCTFLVIIIVVNEVAVVELFVLLVSLDRDSSSDWYLMLLLRWVRPLMILMILILDHDDWLFKTDIHS